jgi:hypothetical protein
MQSSELENRSTLCFDVGSDCSTPFVPRWCASQPAARRRGHAAGGKGMATLLPTCRRVRTVLVPRVHQQGPSERWLGIGGQLLYPVLRVELDLFRERREQSHVDLSTDSRVPRSSRERCSRFRFSLAHFLTNRNLCRTTEAKIMVTSPTAVSCPTGWVPPGCWIQTAVIRAACL